VSTADPLSSLGAGGANTLGKYRLIAELGRGGMSEVYLACAVGPAGFNKLTVIKQIKADLAEDPDFVTMFLEEARLAARLSHPNVVQTNEVGQDHQRFFIAMEYLEGQPYSRILNRLGRDRGLPLGMSLRILCDVCAGLHHAHELTDYNGSPLEVVHRDVTPHNVFITYQGQVKIVDFGIAKAMNSSLETRTGVLKGKVGYMAPEQARGERVDRRADLFSVGVMLWEAAVGRRLWKGLSEVAVLHRLLHGEIPRPREMRPDISDRLESIIMGALAVDRDHRYPSAAALAADLEELIDGPGMRTTVREIGALVAQAFADDRSKLRQIVDQQLGHAQALNTGLYQAMRLPVVEQAHPSSGELPVMRVSPDDESGPSRASRPGVTPSNPSGSNPSGSNPSGSYPSGANPTAVAGASGGYAAVDPRASSPQHPVALPPGYSTHTPTPSAPGGSGQYHFTPSGNYAHYSGPGHDGRSSHPPFGAPSFGTPADAPRSARLTVAALAIAVATGGLAAVLWYGVGRERSAAATGATVGESGAPSSETASSPPPVSPEATASSVPASDAPSIELKIELDPSSAIVRVDGEPARLPIRLAPGGPYEISAEADGYETMTRSLTIAEGASPELAFELEKKRPAATYVPGASPASPPPSKSKSPTPQFDGDMTPPTEAPKRPLDAENPYAQ
jgi:serine/threonine protein kinase